MAELRTIAISQELQAEFDKARQTIEAARKEAIEDAFSDSDIIGSPMDRGAEQREKKIDAVLLELGRAAYIQMINNNEEAN